MTNSNDRNNLATDQTDDLIAELARIVADDARQSSVSQAVDERTKLAADARTHVPAARSFEPIAKVETPAFGASSTSAEASKEPAPTETSPFTPDHSPLPFSQVGDGVTAIRSDQNAMPAEENPSTSPNLGDGATQTAVPFEFDFSHNIKAGLGALENSSVDPIADNPVQNEDVVSTVQSSAPVDEFANEEVPTPDTLDGIAAIIEDVELQSAAPSSTPFEPIPVLHATPQQTDLPEPAAAVQQPASTPNDGDVDGAYDYIPQQALHVPAGEDEFAVPPTLTNDSAEIHDPLTDIENLISDTNTPSVSPEPRPADAAEAAILAALASAAGSRSRIETSPVAAARASTVQKNEPMNKPMLETAAPTARDSINPQYRNPVQPEPAQKYLTEHRRGGVLPIIASVSAIVLLALIGGVGYWIFTGQGQVGQDIPVVAAQNTQVKEIPEVEPTNTNGSSVFNALEGNTEATSSEQIISRDETAGASGTDVARVVTPNSSSNGLTNRKVKTVTVLADGTIVSGTEASAGAEQLPQDVRPNAPTVAVATPSGSTDEIANVLNAIKEGNQAPALPTELLPPGADASVAPELPAATQNAALAADEPAAPQPPIRPIGLGVGVAPALGIAPAQPSIAAQPLSLLPTANAISPPASTNSATTAGVLAPFYVQLASQRSVETAQATASSLQSKYPTVLGNQTIDINRVDLDDKGIYFRVRVPTSSLAEANALCSSLKSSGGDCFVRNN